MLHDHCRLFVTCTLSLYDTPNTLIFGFLKTLTSTKTSTAMRGESLKVIPSHVNISQLAHLSPCHSLCILFSKQQRAKKPKTQQSHCGRFRNCRIPLLETSYELWQITNYNILYNIITDIYILCPPKNFELSNFYL